MFSAARLRKHFFEFALGTLGIALASPLWSGPAALGEIAGGVTPSAVCTTMPATASAVSTSGVSVAEEGVLQLHGYAGYRDRDGTQHDLTYATVELMDGNEVHLAWDQTDHLGGFHFEVPNPGDTGFYARLYAHRDQGSKIIAVLSWGGVSERDDAYYATTATYTAPDGERSWGTFTVNNDWESAPAFWIYDDIVQAAFYGGDTPGRFVAEWSPSSAHTDYHPGGNMHVAAHDADNNPDPVLRLGAKNLMYNWYGGRLPSTTCGAPGRFAVTTAECAFVEGFADWWTMANTNEEFVRTASGTPTDLETPTWGDGQPYGDLVPGRVAGALLDLEDWSDDGYDAMDGRFFDVREVVMLDQPDTFAEFWAAWKARGFARHDAVKAIYQNTIDYNTAPTFGGLPNKSLSEGGSLPDAISLHSYASDPESEDWELLFSVYNAPEACGVSIDAGGRVDIAPDPDWCGTENVTIACSDGIRTRYDTFALTATCVNDAPRMSGLPDKTVDEDSNSDRIIDLYSYTYDPDNADSALTFSILSNTNPQCGVSIDSNRYIDINPVPDWNGISYVTIAADDPAGLQGFDTFLVTVKAVNDAPALAGIPNRTLAEDTSLDNTIDLHTYTHDVDDVPANWGYTIVGNTDPRCGVSIDSGRYIDINPALNWDGYSDVTIRVRDAGGLTDTDVFRVTVTGSNDPPLMSHVPDIIWQKDTSGANIGYAGNFAEDPESGDSELVYTLTGTEPKCGLALDSAGWFDIKPASGWAGYGDYKLRATDPQGLWDEISFRAAIVDVYAGLAEARANANGSWVGTNSKVVSAVFSDRFYVQDPWRAAGLCIAYAPGPAAGTMVRFAGTLSTVSGERRLTPCVLEAIGTPGTPRPLVLRNDSLGGNALDAYTSDVPAAAACAYNIGLLVRTTGRVMKSADGVGFYIWDGGRVVDSRLANGDPWLFVAPAPTAPCPPVGAYVRVTGISGVSLLDGKTIRTLRPRTESDIYTVLGP